ncbi:unnamed protein product [Parnassius mnemosyne]|uniref:Major facilitator superfamily (MFS) profile domain-containing protein n=1 Tax=Parnassius mnemosyne TaxID=213953 RepID=A0AAV1K7B8_9NEOP
MSANKKVDNDGKIHLEAALDLAGFGPYSYIMTSLTGFIIISHACIVFSAPIIIPASACELKTTNSQQGYIAAGQLFGIILGGVVGGYLGDKFGRRRVLRFTLISGAVINGITSISVNWIMLLTMQSLASFCAASIFPLSMAFLSESVPKGKRNLLVLLVNSISIMSQGILAVIAIPIIPLPFSFYIPALGIYWNSWRTLLFVYSTPSLLSALWLCFTLKSPKYVFAQGLEEEAIDIIKAIHRWNNRKTVKEIQIKGLRLDAEQLDGPTSSKNQIVPLFKTPLLKYTVIMTTMFLLQQIGSFTIWMPTIANHFVEMVKTGVGTDKSLCNIIRDSIEAPVDQDIAPCALKVTSLLFVLSVGALQSLVNALLSLVVNRVGYRNMVICVTIVSGTSGVIVNLIPNAYTSAFFFMIFVTGVLVTGMYMAIAVTLFPTHLRALAVALTSTAGSIGMIASVQILNLLLQINCNAGFYLFSGLFVASAFIAALLPDDRYLKETNKRRREE